MPTDFLGRQSAYWENGRSASATQIDSSFEEGTNRGYPQVGKIRAEPCFYGYTDTQQVLLTRRAKGNIGAKVRIVRNDEQLQI